MSLKKIEQVKRDKGFKIFDLIIYGVLVVTVAVLFIVFFTTRNTNPLTGVRVFVQAKIVFEYEFGKEPVFTESVTADDVEENSSALTVTVRTKDGVNVLYINKEKKTVKMKDADCKGKQCLYFQPISDNNKFIYCSPHGLRVEPLLKDLDNPDIII